MKTQTIFVLWDDVDGHRVRRLYLDKESADIALVEHYTQCWIDGGRAKVEEVEAVSYVWDDKPKQ